MQQLKNIHCCKAGGEKERSGNEAAKRAGIAYLQFPPDYICVRNTFNGLGALYIAAIYDEGTFCEYPLFFGKKRRDCPSKARDTRQKVPQSPEYSICCCEPLVYGCRVLDLAGSKSVL